MNTQTQTPKWDVDLMKRSNAAITSFTAGQRDELNDLVWLVNNHQRNNEQWVADIYAEKYFALFGRYLIGDQSLMQSLAKA